jgi:cyclopropane fatty-acyl-phospholipid synthase-like methyltransferase
MTDEEYETYWDELGGIREAIASDLSSSEPGVVLDMACGWGYYTIRLAESRTSGMMVAVDVVPSAFTHMKRAHPARDALKSVEPVMADAVRLPLRNSVFDLTTSFLGMRDIYMTTGEEGVRASVAEMIRATKPSCTIALALTPPDTAETEDLRIAIRVEGEVFGARSMPSSYYGDIFRREGIELISSKPYLTGVKMTAGQARTEIMDGIPIAREIYSREVPDFEEIWERFGPTIERHGYAMYSKVTVLLGRKG